MNANDVKESTYALPEKTKRGPPTNKNISVRNMKAQIANMSLNENAGFKNEYHVKLKFYIFFSICSTYCKLLNEFILLVVMNMPYCRTYREVNYIHA